MGDVILGLHGTGDWATDQDPGGWREVILRLYPNGEVPLTAMLAKSRSEMTPNPEFNWWTKELSEQGGDLTATGVYTDAGLSSAYVSGGTDGDTVYCEAAEAVIEQFKVGHSILIRDKSDPDADIHGYVMDRKLDGANSYIAVKLREADGSAYLASADYIMAIGPAAAEGAEPPAALWYKPTKVTNYTQIFTDVVHITGTARETALRTGDAYQERKEETLLYHGIGIEKAFLWGKKKEWTDSTTGEPVRTTDGLITMTRDNASANVSDYVDDGSGTWLAGGENWLNSQLNTIHQRGRTEKFGFMGPGAANGLNRLALSGGQLNLQANAAEYGIQVRTWIHANGVLHLKLHPLFVDDPIMTNGIFIFEPQELRYRFLRNRDTNFKPVSTRLDATEERYLTEAGLEYHHFNRNGLLFNVGQDAS